ncbi:hypothetical protein EON67_12305 [archaeon]|nr:MAG: hypothetical protein EON67_12305 [archaeon]
MYVREDTAGPLGKAPPLPLMFGVERICASTSEVVQSVPPATWLRQSAAALVADMMSSFRPPAARSLKAAQWEATLRERTDAVVDAALALSVSMGGAAASGSAAVVATEADSLRMSEALLRHVRAWLLRKLHTQSSSIRIVTFPTSV